MTSRRVLSISHSYVVALNRALPNALARLGWEVTVVAPAQFQGDLRSISLEFDGKDAARVVPITLHLHHRVHLMTWSRELRGLLANDWDIVHAWEEPYIPAGAQIARWRRTGRLVFASFQNIPKRYPPPFNWLERYSASRMDAWVAFGRTVEDALRARPGYARLPHRVAPPGVDLARFAPDPEARNAAREELGFSVDDVVVGFAGRFVPQKGCLTLTAAFERMRHPCKALFVGGGPLAGEISRSAARHDRRVRVITDATHARMPRYLAAMDLLALPSRTTRHWREQFGRVLVEAMACGVPVLGSDSGEIPHVIGDAGVVLPEGDVDAWARTLDGLAGDPDRRRELAARGLGRAELFSADAAAAAHSRFFEELLSA